MSLLRTMALVMLICWFVVACAGTGGFDRSAVAAVPLAQPEAASGLTTKPGWVARRFAVAAANPLASQAGAQVLRQGGSAVDAAIAVQMVLTLVEPQSSGIGGGAFLLHHDGRRVQAFDGRETAPAAAEPTLFLDQKGTPLPFMEALVGGRSVGTPGAVAMLAQAHHQHGKLPWASLFEPAIGLAEDGFAVSPRLHTLLKTETALQKDPVAAAYFYNDDGQPHPVGHVLKNPDLAAVLRAIASRGPQAFYDGPVALAMVNKVQQHPANPGRLNAEDLKHYQPKDREALCFQHLVQQRALRICGFPPPGSGALAIGQIMGLLARTPHATAAPAPGAPPSPDWLHTYTEASRLAFADRAQYLADPDFVEAPAGRWHSLLDAHYLDDRARLIGNARMTTVPAGQPGGVNSSWASMPEQPEYGTSHISIVDAWGNALAMTTTIEAGFGSRLMVNTSQGRTGGFLLNNQLTDFSFTPTDAQGRLVANRLEPGKRPRSSMSPTLVFDAQTGQLLMSVGSPGGALIIHFTAKTLLGTLHWGLNPQAAIDLPNFGTLGGPLLLEAGRFPAATVQALQQRGHTVTETALPSGLQALQRGMQNGQAVWLGGADPRREGIVAGD
ncbi:MAG: gamma-glutamyltransferase family protein [Hydrogenophaga sp.]|uniref:gamma-glutamyltransferase family protein n=1 Tax=Hydrogenophaga sp. TaxID=1904254 RepID=UPI002731243E|nr:gamma-glutamyltransferase family protein [Hydrogenophaga sp.]MDP2164064.1 gamma-glutamyltransferase family protein [Hydrogenophaga sp.]MDP3477143.1 gamma-glutamyltransferase family protein [Hydrogenophaga sp.]